MDAEERQRSFGEMIQLALETAVSSSVTGVTDMGESSVGKENGKYMEDNHVVIYGNGQKYNTDGIPAK